MEERSAGEKKEGEENVREESDGRDVNWVDRREEKSEARGGDIRERGIESGRRKGRNEKKRKRVKDGKRERKTIQAREDGMEGESGGENRSKKCFG